MTSMNVFIINAGIAEIILVADVLYILLLSHIHTAYKTLVHLKKKIDGNTIT